MEGLVLTPIISLASVAANGTINYFERYISKIEYDAPGRIKKVVIDGQNFSFHA